jgi:hypothetical protein
MCKLYGVWQQDWCIMNFKTSGRHSSPSLFEVLSWHFLKGLRKGTQSFSHDSRSSYRDSNQTSPE